MKPYGVLHYHELTILVDKAQELVEKGFVPVGAITKDGDCYMQAMFKKPAAKKRKEYADGYPQWFEDVWAEYPKRAGANPKKKAYQAANARLVSARLVELCEGVIRYREFIQATGKMNTEFVMQAATFFGPDKHYLEDWSLPEPEKSNGLPKSDDELEGWAKERGLSAGRAGESYAQWRRRLLEELR